MMVVIMDPKQPCPSTRPEKRRLKLQLIACKGNASKEDQFIDIVVDKGKQSRLLRRVSALPPDDPGQLPSSRDDLQMLESCSAEEINMIIRLCYLLKFVVAFIHKENSPDCREVVVAGAERLDRTESERRAAIGALELLLKLSVVEKAEDEENIYRLTFSGIVFVGYLEDICKKLVQANH